MLNFHIFGVKKNKKQVIFIILVSNKNKKQVDNLDEIGQMLVSRALDWTKKIRKIAADIFAKSGLEKP